MINNTITPPTKTVALTDGTTTTERDEDDEVKLFLRL
jgi:hypothetical protein